MKRYFFILFFLPFSMISQNRDYVIFEGKKYKGKLLQYSNIDLSFENSGYLLFFDKKKQDTIKVSSDLIYKLKIRKSNQFFEFDKKSWNNIEMGFNFDSWAVPHGELFFSKGIVNDKYLDPESVELDVDKFIDIKGWKAIGNKISYNKIRSGIFSFLKSK